MSAKLTLKSRTTYRNAGWYLECSDYRLCMWMGLTRAEADAGLAALNARRAVLGLPAVVAK